MEKLVAEVLLDLQWPAATVFAEEPVLHWVKGGQFPQPQLPASDNIVVQGVAFHSRKKR